jgi:flagellar basal-body rod protein FlgB
MFTDLNVFKTAFAMAEHAGKRQALVAENMANADTPGFRPKDLEHFKNAFTTNPTADTMRATRSGHLGAMSGTDFKWETVVHTRGVDPNENGVSIEDEMLRAVDVRRQHDRALSIYKSALNILRTSLGRQG